MESIIQTFHIDWKLMIAQLVNFAIVASVLWYFAVRPLIKKMEERSLAVKKTFDDSQKAEENVKQSEAQKAELLKEGKKQAQAIIQEAVQEAEEKSNALVAEAQEKTDKVIMEAKAKIEKQKQTIIAEAKKELSDIVIEGIKRLSLENIDAKTQEKILNKSIDDLKKESL